MSNREAAAAAIIAQVALAADGAVLGLALAYIAVRSFINFTSTSSSLRKIRNAPSVSVSCLRSLLSDEDSQPSEEDKIVIVRGEVEAKSAVDGNWRRQDVLLSHESREKAVVLQRTQTCIYNEWRGFFGWTSDLRSFFTRSWKEQESISFRTVPFVLVEGGHWSHSDYVVVNLDGSRHPLPLTTVYHQLQPVKASPYTFLQALFGHEYPVGLLDEEKILPLGKNISAVGICSSKDGIFEIKSCNDLPYFLSDMTKAQMVVDLDFREKVLFWSTVVIGSVSICVLGFAALRNWNRWKEWRQQRRTQQSSPPTIENIEAEIIEDDETTDVPDGQLCVICLLRRRRSVFVPCGHLVCCQRCALSVERELTPKCPVCRQEIRNSVRIYAS